LQNEASRYQGAKSSSIGSTFGSMLNSVHNKAKSVFGGVVSSASSQINNTYNEPPQAGQNPAGLPPPHLNMQPNTNPINTGANLLGAQTTA